MRKVCCLEEFGEWSKHVCMCGGERVCQRHQQFVPPASSLHSVAELVHRCVAVFLGERSCVVHIFLPLFSTSFVVHLNVGSGFVSFFFLFSHSFFCLLLSLRRPGSHCQTGNLFKRGLTIKSFTMASSCSRICFHPHSQAQSGLSTGPWTSDLT